MTRQYGTPPTPPGQKPQMSAGYSGGTDTTRKDDQPTVKKEDPTPPTSVVTMFHRNASVDTKPEDIHHTLGGSPSQAAAGSHTHNGSDSPLLLGSSVITGSKASPSTVLPSIIAALKILGATDTTT